MRRYAAIFAVMLIFIGSVCMPIAANVDEGTDVNAVSEESMPETNDEQLESERGNGALQVYMLAGSVIGAMVVVAFIYKKKDEIRYL